MDTEFTPGNKNTYNIACKDAVDKCLKLMEQRRTKYGDSWKNAKEYRLLAMIVEKADRLEMNFESGNTNYEGVEDSLIDIVNWSLFYLQNLKDGKYKK